MTNGHEVKFTTRYAWDNWGDLSVDGEDFGWHTLGDAQRAAAERTTELVVVHEDDYTIRNPRRES